MKFNLTITEMSEDELIKVTNLLNGLDSNIRTKPNSDPVVEMFENISWEAFAVAHTIYQYGAEDLALSFDRIRKILNITDRAISSRVGGTQRVARRLKIPSLLTIKDMQTTKLVKLEKSYVELLEEYLDGWKTDYLDWLDSNNLDQLKKDFIVWNEE